MSNYSRANTTAQWFQGVYPGSVQDPDKVVWHSTEGTGWPPYDGGSKAPTYTTKWNFSRKLWEWRAHFPDERSARALRNESGGVQTNRDDTIQVEIVGTCDPKAHRSWKTQHVYTPELSTEMIDGLADFVRDMNRRHKIPYRALTFRAYPASAGDSPVRMSNSAWSGFSGHCGHQHVPENTHGDPGDIPMRAIIDRAAGTTPAPAPSAKDEDMFLASVPGADPRVFLMLDNGYKRLVPNAEVLKGLKAAGIRDAGDVSSATLGMWQSMEGLENYAYGWRSTAAKSLSALAATLGTLATSVGDDATAAQVEEVRASLNELQESVAALAPPTDPEGVSTS